VESKKRIGNSILLAVSILFTGWFIYKESTDWFIMTKETLALFLFDFGILSVLFSVKSLQYIILFILVILLFNAVDISYTVKNGDASTTYHSTTTSLGINPIVFLILGIYLVISRKAVVALYILMRRGSEEEQKEKAIKEFNFYYNKFRVYDDTEIAKIENNIDLYLPAAQQAIKKVVSERTDRFN